MLIASAIIFAITTIYLFVTSLVVLIKSPKSSVNISLAVALLFIGVWLLGVAGLSTSLGHHVLYGRTVFVAAGIGVQALYLFVYYFVRLLNLTTNWFYNSSRANAVAGLMLPVTLLTPFVVKRVEFTHSSQLPAPVYGLFYLGYVLWLLLLIVSIAVLLYRAYRISLRKERRQIQAVALGLLLFVSIAFLTNVILPPIFHTVDVAKLSPVGAIVLALFLSYAVLKHRFLDIRLLIVRALSYVLSVLGLGCMYGVATFFIITELLGAQTTSLSQRVINAALAVVLAFLFQPTKHFFDKLTRRLFYREAYDTQTVLDQASNVIVGNVKLESLGQTVLALLDKALHPEYSGLFVANNDIFISTTFKKSPEELSQIKNNLHLFKTGITATDKVKNLQDKSRLQEAGVALIIPLRAHQEIVGYLLFGEKLSGSQYDHQDIRLLSIVADSLAIAIQNALRFKEIENFNHTLQDKIEKATHQLRSANDRLRALDETKDDFVSMASHQLRTPLTSVKGYMSMVLDGDAGKITAAQRKLLDQSFASAQRMVYLISDLLNLSRLKTGKFVIMSTPTNLVEVVRDELDQFRSSATERQLALNFSPPAHFPTLMIDETKTRQVIMNFIDNAIYYTPANGHIEVKLVDKPSSVEFTVTDDGIGVPAAERHHLFTKFYRASNARKTRPDGTGLGLFMAKKVIAAQGGAIIFSSHEGQGSTFGFSFAKDKPRN